MREVVKERGFTFVRDFNQHRWRGARLTQPAPARPPRVSTPRPPPCVSPRTPTARTSPAARACVPQDYWVGKAADVDLTDVAAALGDWGWDVTI